MRAAIYCRVSTKRQALQDVEEGEEHYSLKMQESACRAYCEEQGWDVVRVYQEEMSAKTLDRPQLTELRDSMRRREIDKVVIYKLDRLSRNINQQGTLFYEAEWAHVEIVSATRDFENTPEGEIIRVVVGVIAQRERENIAKRTDDGRRQKLSEGKYSGRGRIPYGYRKSGRKLEFDPDSIDVARRIFALALQGYSATMIATELQRGDDPTPNGLPARKWTASTIKSIVANEVYKGQVINYRHRWETDPVTGKRSFVEQPREQWIIQDGIAPPIVTEQEWEVAAIRMNSNNATQWQATTKDRGTLFTTAQQVVCGVCGTSFLRLDEERKRRLADGTMRYYAPMPSYTHNKITAITNGCTRATVAAYKVDDVVWQAVQETVTHPDMLASLIPDTQQVTERLRGDVDVEERKVADLTKRHRRAQRTYEDFCEQLDRVDDADDTDRAERQELFQRVRDTRKMLTEAEESLRVAKERLAQAIASSMSRDTIVKHLMDMAPMIQDADLALRRDFMVALGVQVRVYPKTEPIRWAAMYDRDPEKVFVAVDQQGKVVTDCTKLLDSRCTDRSPPPGSGPCVRAASS